MSPSSTTKVKICGLRTEADIDVAVEAGADYIGLVFFPPSPRNLSIEVGQRLAAYARGRASIVALLVDADDELITQITSQVAPDLLQLHGSESVERIKRIREISDVPVMKVIKIASAEDAQAAFTYAPIVKQILFDAKAPKGSPLPGGNGLRFDWHAIEPVQGRLEFMLSGGLTAENVAEAIRLTGAAAVDVSSGVESEPGIKDPARIRAFLRAAKGL